MICTPSRAHERGINSFTTAPIVVKMKSEASLNVHENAPNTACPIDRNTLPTRCPIPRMSAGANPATCPAPAAYAGTPPASTNSTAPNAERRTIKDKRTGSKEP